MYSDEWLLSSSVDINSEILAEDNPTRGFLGLSAYVAKRPD
jgi:hypothetical protein